MNKNELIAKMATTADVSKSIAASVLNAFIECINEALQNNEEVRIVGFGCFSTAKRGKMKGRNPKTGDIITIPASTRPKFKAGKQLIEAANS